MPELTRSLKSAALRHLAPVVLAACAAMPAHAVVFNESGDAGQTVAGAQSTTGAAGTLTDIFGNLGGANDADLFVINITNAAAFSATTVNAGSGNRDTQLFLFKLSGAPVYANDDTPAGTSFLSTLPAGLAVGPLAPGLYILGIALSGYEPVNVNGQLLFAPIGLSTDVRGPAVGLQPALLSGFDGAGFLPAGLYDIQLTGAAVAAVPEVSTSAMFLLAGALAAVGRARRRAAVAPAGR